jgi:hypothetical protein
MAVKGSLQLSPFIPLDFSLGEPAKERPCRGKYEAKARSHRVKVAPFASPLQFSNRYREKRVLCHYSSGYPGHALSSRLVSAPLRSTGSRANESSKALTERMGTPMREKQVHRDQMVDTASRVWKQREKELRAQRGTLKDRQAIERTAMKGR